MLCVGLALSLVNGCAELAKWRDSQIQTSHQLGKGTQVAAPAQPIQLPADIARQLPLDASFTILSFTDNGTDLRLSALSAWDTAATAQWMITDLAARGYDSGDNASRILEGVDYGNSKAEYPRLHVQVTLNSSDQCLIELQAWKK